MAGVSDRRGQLLLIGGLLLAVAIIALAIVFNSAVMTSSLAGQAQQDVSVNDVRSMQEDVRTSVAGLIRRAEEAHSDPTKQEKYIKENISAINNQFQRYASSSGVIINISFNDTFARDSSGVQPGKNGSRVWKSSGNFTNKTFVEENWPIGQENRIRDFRVNITDLPQYVTPGTGPNSTTFTFREKISVSSESYRVHLYNDTTSTTGAPYIRVTGDSISPRTCYAQDRLKNDAMNISLTEATLDGKRCNALDFFNHLEKPYYIAVRNGSDARGSYELKTGDEAVDHNWHNSKPHLYGVLIDFEYHSHQMDYNSTIAIAPGEPS